MALSRRRSRDYTEPEVDEVPEEEAEADERPARRRSADAPSRRSRSTETERSTRRRAAEEDEAPRRATRVERSSTRRGTRAEPEERTAPARARRGSPDRQAGAVRGWSSYEKVRRDTANPDTFSVGEEQTLIVFLEPEPFVVFQEHWINELEGRKSRTCMGDGCPLCGIGDRPRLRVCFNVIDWADVDKPTLKVWQVGPRVAETLKNFADSKMGPLDREDICWAVSKTGKGTKTETAIVPVKARDLDEDWDRDPIDPDVLDDLAEGLFGEDFVRSEQISELEEIADSLS